MYFKSAVLTGSHLRALGDGHPWAPGTPGNKCAVRAATGGEVEGLGKYNIL